MARSSLLLKLINSTKLLKAVMHRFCPLDPFGRRELAVSRDIRKSRWWILLLPNHPYSPSNGQVGTYRLDFPNTLSVIYVASIACVLLLFDVSERVPCTLLYGSIWVAFIYSHPAS